MADEKLASVDEESGGLTIVIVLALVFLCAAFALEALSPQSYEALRSVTRTFLSGG